MKSSRMLLGFTCVIMFALCACTNSEQTTPSNSQLTPQVTQSPQQTQAPEPSVSNEKQEETPSSIATQLSENVRVDAEVNTIESGKLVSVITGQFKEFNEKKLIDSLFSVPESVTEEGYENLAEGSKIFTDNKASYLMISPGSVNFSTDISQFIQNIHSYSKSTSMTLEFVSPFVDTVFDFATKEQAFNDIKSLLNSFDVEVASYQNVTCMDYETMSKLEAEMRDFQANDTSGMPKSEFKGEWSEDDNCYVFDIPITLSGIALDSADGSGISVMYSKNGIESMYISRAYSQESIIQSDQSLISMDIVMEAVKNKLDMIISDKELVIKDISLVYRSQMIDKSLNPPHNLIPAWRIGYDQRVFASDGKEYAPRRTYTYFNAINGEELI